MATDLELSIFYHNCSGLRTKIKNLYIDIKSCNYNLIILTETWLNDSFKNEEIFDNDWLVYRKDRNYEQTNTSRGGGVLIAIRNNIASDIVEVNFDSNSEQIWAQVNSGRKTIFIGAIYIPPNSCEESYLSVLSSIDEVNNKMNENDAIFLFGDWNRPNLEFVRDDDNQNSLLPINIENAIDFKLIDALYSNNIYQISHVENDNFKQLDLIFSNETDNFIIREAKDNELLLKNSPHHRAILVNYTCSGRKYNVLNHSELVLDFKSADYNKINIALQQINWNNLYCIDNTETIISTFYEYIFQVIDKLVPKKAIKNKTNEPWLTKELRNLRNRRNRAHRKRRNVSNEHNDHVYFTLFREFQEKSTTAYDQYTKKVGDEILNNPKKFFEFVNMKRKCQGYPSTIHFDNTSSSDPREICQLFAERFQEVYHDPSDFIVNNPVYSQPKFEISNIYLSDTAISKGILELDLTNNAGPDKIHPRFLYNCVSNLIEPLHFIFNHSLSTGSFPSEWKKTFLIPIFKDGTRNDAKNYRGVATLSALPKLFEKLIHQQLLDIVPDHLNVEQHGFIKGRSTTTNLVMFSSFLLNSMESNSQIDTVYTDFSKAFDRVQHSILFGKLEQIGFSGNALNWIKSYLTNRKQRVKFVGLLSDEINVTSGVSQGSHLGPLLFNIFISDLSLTLGGINHLFYADDLKIFHIINNASDAAFLQNKIDELHTWCISNCLDLNIAKCNIISFTKRKTTLDFSYFVDNVALNRVETIMDLGILFDCQINFKPHINKILGRSYGLLGFIKRRAREFNNTAVTKTLYISFVRSILEYGSVVWMPCRTDCTMRIESVQKQFLLFALRELYDPRDFANLPSYNDRLQIIGLESLADRRTMLSACFTFDVLKNNIKNRLLTDQFKLNTNRQLRNSKYLEEKFHKTDYGKNDPIARGCRIFNTYIKCYDKDQYMSKLIYKKRLKLELGLPQPSN